MRPLAVVEPDPVIDDPLGLEIDRVIYRVALQRN